MNDAKERLMPGTAMSYSEPDANAFSRIEQLIDAAGGLSLSQVCAITGLEGTTIQNWVKRGWVSNPRGKKYDQAQIARILIINALKECLKLESISQLLEYINNLSADGHGGVIKESDLFNYMCRAINILRRAEDFSRHGVEAVAENVLSTYEAVTAHSRVKLRKALSVMIFACVCTDVKRRTESMLDEVIADNNTDSHEKSVESYEQVHHEMTEDPAVAYEAPRVSEEKEPAYEVVPATPVPPPPAPVQSPLRSLFFKKGS